MKRMFLYVVAFTLLGMPIMGFADDEKVELVEYMSKLQYFSHKAGLSIQAENAALAHFYLHEVEEVIELVREVKEYDGHPIGQLASTILEPAFETLEMSVDANQFKQAQTDYGEMLKACNQCHTATEHGFIKIMERSDNPFMQSFAP